MSVKIHPRSWGATIKCNYCPNKVTTGQPEARLIRHYARTLGWIRGLLKRSTGSAKTGYGELANTRYDICPGCAPAERARDAARKAAAMERLKQRDATRKLTPEQRMARIKERRERAAKKRKEKRKEKRSALKAMVPEVAA